MSFIEFIKKNLISYFIIVTAVTVVIAILGMVFDPDTVFGYEAYFSPLIFGAIAVLPSFVLYSRRELSFQQMLFRRIMHFLVLETCLLGFGWLAGLITSMEVGLSLATSVFLVYLFTNLVHYIIDNKTAGDINKGLKRIQE